MPSPCSSTATKCIVDFGMDSTLDPLMMDLTDPDSDCRFLDQHLNPASCQVELETQLAVMDRITSDDSVLEFGGR